MLFPTLLILIALTTAIGAQGSVVIEIASKSDQSGLEDSVIVPLVEEDGNTGIPIMLQELYVVVDLIFPENEDIHVSMDDDPNYQGFWEVTVTIIDGISVRQETIKLQDWPQSGPVIPMNQDWPQGGLLLIPIQDWPQKSFLSIEIQQDWPQYMIDGQLV
jgi:hypothetical protein